MSPPGTATGHRPESQQDAAGVLAACAERGERVRVLGAGTKAGWGNAGLEYEAELHTGGLDEVLEHNQGDLTAVLEAGTPLARAQAEFAEAGQMLALDPPLGDDAEATIGGVLATGDTGPLRHRYGAARDLVVGITMALSDGTIARSGGKVIKNVAGYDLAKLLSGSFGTLGVILELAVRLHPLAPEPVTARAACNEPDLLGKGASAIAHSQLEAECLDAAWAEGRGEVIARFAGAAASDHAAAALGILADAGLDPAPLDTGDQAWERQRSGQRSAGGVVLRVAGVQSDLPRIAELADGAGASLVGRAGLGVYWLKLDGLADAAATEVAGDLRAGLRPRACVLLDAPEAVRRELDVWDESDPGRLALARRLKQRFDPTSTLNPGIFVGGI